MNQVIELQVWQISKHCTLFCPVCETWTSHHLSKSGEFFACSCGGNFVDIEIKENEDETI